MCTLRENSHDKTTHIMSWGMWSNLQVPSLFFWKEPGYKAISMHINMHYQGFIQRGEHPGIPSPAEVPPPSPPQKIYGNIINIMNVDVQFRYVKHA